MNKIIQYKQKLSTIKINSLLLMILTTFSLAINAQTSNVDDSLFYKIKEATDKHSEILLVLLHGYGANEDDLFQLSRFFPGNYTIVSPRATFTLRPGSYQWYQSMIQGQSFDGKKEDLDKSQQMIKELVVRMQRQLHINASHTIIAGFSQGANMSYQMGLLYPGLCKGIGVLSGTIFNSQKEQILKENNTSLTIFIGHGTKDNRIPYPVAESSKQWLEANKFEPEFHVYKGMSHSISPQEIEDFISFIGKIIK